MMIYDRHWLTLIIDLHFSTMINMLGNASWNISSISSLAASRRALWRWSSSAAPRYHGTIQDGGMLETGYQGELIHTHMLSHVVSFVGALWIKGVSVTETQAGVASELGAAVFDIRVIRFVDWGMPLQSASLSQAGPTMFQSVRSCFLLQQVSFP